jgi:hypothetical protein
VAIGNRERVTVQAVGGLELPLEVGAPAMVGSEDLADSLRSPLNFIRWASWQRM